MSKPDDLALCMRGLLARGQTTAVQATSWLLTTLFNSQNFGGVVEGHHNNHVLAELSFRYRSLPEDLVFSVLFQCGLGAFVAESVQVLPPQLGAHLVHSLTIWASSCGRKDDLLLVLRGINTSLPFCDGDCTRCWPFSGLPKLLPSAWFSGSDNQLSSRGWSASMSRALEYTSALRSFCEDVLKLAAEDSNLLTGWFLSLILACLASLLSEHAAVWEGESKTTLFPLLQSVGSVLRRYSPAVLSGDEFVQDAQRLLSEVATCKTLVLSSCLQTLEGGILFASLQDTLAQHERYFSGVTEKLMVLSDTSAEAALLKSINCITKKAAGYNREWAEVLRRKELWDNHVWFDFIEANCSQFLGRDLCLQFVDILVWARAQLKEECHWRITGILLKAYEQLSAVEQWSIRRTILTKHTVNSKTGWVDLFSPISECHLMTKNHPAVFVLSSLTSILNKLHASGEKQAPQPLVTCALLMPLQLLRELINRVFAQAGLVDVVVSILKTLGLGDETLCEGKKSLTLLTFAVDDCLKQLDGGSMDKYSKAVLQFVEAVCKPFHLDESVAFNGQNVTVSVPLCLLKLSELLQGIVLPALKSCKSNGNEAAPLPSVLMLDLFHFAVGQWQGVWPADVSVEAVLSALTTVWPFACGQEPVCLQLRTSVRACSSVVSQVLLSQLEADSSLSWLSAAQAWFKEHAHLVDWQYALLWQPLCAALHCLPLRVPACLLRVCDLPTSDWHPVVMEEYGGSQVWVALLQFARARPKLAQAAVLSLKKKVKGNTERLSRFLASAAARVMPTCCRQEWLAIMNEFIQPLLASNLITLASPLAENLQWMAVDIGERLQALVGVVHFAVLVAQLTRDLMVSEEDRDDDLNQTKIIGGEDLVISWRWMNIADLLSFLMRDIIYDLGQMVTVGLNEEKCWAVVDVYGSLCAMLNILPSSFSDSLLLVASALLNQEELKQFTDLCAHLVVISRAALADDSVLAELLLHLPVEDC